MSDGHEIRDGHESEIYNRNAPTTMLHWLSPWLYDIAKRPFESDGRRKLYDRPPANAARFRDITNRFDLPPRMPTPELLRGKE